MVAIVAISPQLHYLYRNGIENAVHCFDAIHLLVQPERVIRETL